MQCITINQLFSVVDDYSYSTDLLSQSDLRDPGWRGWSEHMVWGHDKRTHSMVILVLKPHYFHQEDKESGRQQRCHRCSVDIYTEEKHLKISVCILLMSTSERVGKVKQTDKII